MTRRDLRAGELTTLLLALVLAVAALTSVGFLADRMRQGLQRDAARMLAADLRVRADHPLPADYRDHATRLGLRTAETAEFPSMATLAERPRTRLASLKAVTDAYPLRGRVSIVTRAGEAPHAAARSPEPGTVWADATLLEALGLRLGDSVQLGARSFRIVALISRELDRGFSFVNFSPRVILRADDLPSTGLTGFGSRITYRLLVAGAPGAVARYQQWLEARLRGANERGVSLETLAASQPQVRQTLDRAQRFLSLVALLSALLAAVAIAMAAHRFARRHLDACAALRCIGASRATLATVFTVEFLLVGLGGGAAGVAMGLLGHTVLLHWLGALLRVDLPLPGLAPALRGIATGLVLLLGFALPPLLPLTRVPPVHVLRREWGVARGHTCLGYLCGLALFAGLLVLNAGDWRLGLVVAGGFAAGLGAFAGLAWLTIRLGAASGLGARGGAGFGVRYALASLARRSAASSLQVTALAIGLMCLLLLGMTRHDLVDAWRRATPPDAPNRFVIDIQPDQVAAIEHALRATGLSQAPLAPMIRGRLVARNGRAIDPDDYPAGRTRRLVEREFNLSYARVLPRDNRIVAGRWYGTARDAQLSIEQGLARQLGIHLGDRLAFDVGGQPLTARVTSLRALDWGNFRVNFFVLMPPDALADMPATFITSLRLPAGRQAVLDALVGRYPNLTVIDIDAILAQVQGMLDQVIGAIQFLFLFTLAAGMLVLYAALSGTRDERAREAGLLRALGASRRQMRRVQWTEFVLVGGLAGLLASGGALAVGAVLARRVFDFPFVPAPWLPFAGIGAGLLCAGLGGAWSLRRVLQRAPLATLREL